MRVFMEWVFWREVCLGAGEGGEPIPGVRDD